MGFLDNLKNFMNPIDRPQPPEDRPKFADFEEFQQRQKELERMAQDYQDTQRPPIETPRPTQKVTPQDIQPVQQPVDLDEGRFDGIDLPKREHLDYLEQNIFPQTRAAGIPDAVVATQWTYEGGGNMNPSGNNPWGLGPGNEYASLEEANQVYINTILNNSGLGVEGKDGNLVLKEGVTADELLDALAGKYEMHKADKWESIREEKDTPAWRFYNR